MEPLSGWPPDPEELRNVVPLFPLPEVWLVPRTVLPLHIFEPRYRQMIEHSLDGPGRIVLGTILPGHEGDMAGSPPVYPLAGLGEIARHRRHPDGRFDVFLVGLQRVRLAEVESDELYRQVSVEPVEETPVAREDEGELRVELERALVERSDLLNLPSNVPLSHVIDLLLLHMPQPADTKQRAFAELDLAVRARLAIQEHGIRPIVPVKTANIEFPEFRIDDADGE